MNIFPKQHIYLSYMSVSGNVTNFEIYTIQQN